MPLVEVILANPRGFCAGVDRAIAIVERALESYGAPIHVRHEVVHNRYVVEGLKRKGAVFVDELSEVPDGATVIFSAHGVSQAVREEAALRGLKVFDATCPLVTKVHMEVARHGRQGRDVVLIGHAGHPEVEGTMGQWDARNEGAIHLVEKLEDVAALEIENPERVAYVTQTTLSVDDTKAIIAALRGKFPQIEGPRKDDICYATQNRQDAVRELANESDLVLVVGSRNSSNSNRLRELAEKQGVRAFLIDGPESIDRAWLEGVRRIGVTAGASAPEQLVREVIAHLRELGATSVRELHGEPEDVTFALPKELRDGERRPQYAPPPQ
jgi:4-hydroxy-3-methylbut-2-enyl diphosphate reductase